MTPERFWRIVEAARPSVAEDPEGFDRALTEDLLRLPREEVFRFDEVWSDLDRRVFTWEIWAAAWVLRGGCFDYDFMGFRDRLIGLGRFIYERALADPDSLAMVQVDWRAGDDGANRWISTAAYRATSRLGKPAPSEVADGEPVGWGYGSEPAGERWELEDVARCVPRIAAAVGYDPESVPLRHACPCCGYLTIEEPGNFDICDVCWWEDDGLDVTYPDEISGPNHISLNQARENFRNFAASDERHIRDARQPRPWELPHT